MKLNKESNHMKTALLCLLLTSCSLFTRENVKTADDIARELCIKHYGKPGLSVDDVARAYCKDLQPWVDVIVTAETLGAAKVSAKEKQ